MSNQTHLMAASSNGTTPRERGSNRDSERVSQDTPVYDLGISSPPAPAKHTSKGVLVTASVKVPLEVKEAWSREAARRGIKLSEHLRQMLQLVDQSWTEADKGYCYRDVRPGEAVTLRGARATADCRIEAVHIPENQTGE